MYGCFDFLYNHVSVECGECQMRSLIWRCLFGEVYSWCQLWCLDTLRLVQQKIWERQIRQGPSPYDISCWFQPNFLPEKEILEAVKMLAVRESNKIVVKCLPLRPRWSKRSLGVRIQSQAEVCKYIIECPTYDESANHINLKVRNILIRGIADPKTQLHIVGLRLNSEKSASIHRNSRSG